MIKMERYYGNDADDSMAGYYRDQHTIEWPTEPKVRRTVWITKDKQEIQIKNMTDSHLTNTIKMLWREAPLRLSTLTGEAYSFASTLHGECAQDAADAAIDRLEDTTPSEFLAETVPQWKYLLRQARKRKLPIADEDWFDPARAEAEM